jgi:hypothetical protein
MINLASLEQAIADRQAEITNKQTLADKLLSDAETHAANGDEVQAQRDRDSAERYLEDVRIAKQDMDNYSEERRERSEKVKQIDRKIEDLNERYRRDIDRLEQEKASIPVSVITRSEPEIAMHELNNKNLDNNQKDIHKRYQHDLEQLEREKRNLL